MRSVLKTAILASAIIAATPAVAQVYGQSAIPAPMHMRTGGPLIANQPHMNPRHGGGQRWGGSVNGRWQGGTHAPGGWGAYRRPSRGYQLDRYWMSGNFQISDYGFFGLQTPPNGYFWVRYYDDAVLVDSYGRVRDSVSGIAWADAEADAGYGAASASAAASAGGGYGQRGGEIQAVDPNGAYYEDDTGYGEQRYGAPYPEPRGGYAPPMDGGPSAVHVQCRRGCVQQQGGGYGYEGQGYAGQGYAGQGYSSQYSSSGGGYYGGGATTTTVTIQYAPVVTTTTTTEEVIEESSRSYETTYVSRPRTKLVRRHYAPTKRLRRHGCGC
jgi:Ni/Co efflux regulator RcnB